MSDRLTTLRQMSEQDPASAFVRYGLAMELMNLGRLSEAFAEFETLLKASPGYVAAYFHGGRALENLGRIDDARDLYRQGIAASSQVGDTHTRAELEAALAMLP